MSRVLIKVTIIVTSTVTIAVMMMMADLPSPR